MDEEEYNSGKKKPDPLLKLRAQIDQASESVKEIVPLLSTLYNECLMKGLPEELSGSITIFYFNYIMSSKRKK